MRKRHACFWLTLPSAQENTCRAFRNTAPREWAHPITAYNRITDEPCKVHSNIYTPDYVVVVDETLLKSVDVTSGLKESGALIINSRKSSGGECRRLPRRLQGKDLRGGRGEDLHGDPRKEFPEHADAGGSGESEQRHRQRALHKGHERNPSSTSSRTRRT